MRYWPGRCLRIWLLLIFFSSFTVYAQEYSYARYDVKDGLAGSVVYHGVEDQEGFLWFATETGVSRFDGTHFRNFTKADGLPDNEIIKLFVDSKGRVWMMPFRNSICYYWKGKIYNQENDSLLKRIPVADNIRDIVEDRQGSLLFMDLMALYVVSPDQQVTITKKIDGAVFGFSNAGLVASGHFAAFAEMQNVGYYSLAFDAKLKLISKEKLAIPPMMSQCNFLSPDLTTYRNGDRLLFIHQSGQRAVALPPDFTNLSVIRDSLCAINTSNGTYYYDVINNKVFRHALKGMNVNNVFQDKEGNNWFLTAGTGIYRVGSFEFINYTFSKNNKDHLPVFSVNKIDSLVYVGSEKSSLFAIDPKTQSKRFHYEIKGSVDIKITSILRYSPKRIFLGTNQGVIDLRQPDRHRSSSINVKSMHIDGNELLISLQTGVLRATADLVFSDLVGYTRSTCSFVQNKTCYYGTLKGLYALDSTGKNTWLGEKEPLFRSRIACIEGAPDGTLWIGTHGDGLIGYKDGKVRWSIRQQDGLTSDICRNVFIAGNEVWLGTDRGLNRIQCNNKSYTITTFSAADGLMSDIINAIHVEGSQVYVGTPAGLTCFDAGKITLNSSCKMRVTGIQASGQVWAADTAGFSLPPTSNSIRFDYVGISYRSAGDITYRYRLLGLSDDWQTTRETFLNYLALPSGVYELQLMATNKFGVASDMIRIPFQVEKLLWEKTWFRIAALIFAWILIWIFVNARIKRVRRQNDEKLQISNRMTELEQMALKAQMNPHFIFNSLNSVQQYVIDKDLLGANKFITEFSRLIRLTLDISSRTKINIYEEISYLATYLELEKTKFEDKFSYTVTVAPDIDPFDWFIPPMILQPYVENSIRHGVRYRHDKGGHIRVSFKLDQYYLICMVEDNGVGREKAGQYKSDIPIEYQSKGMTLTAKRIEMLNKNSLIPVLIEIEDLEINNIPAGTRVTLRFPLDNASSSN
ncbi:histidine kinase [Paraflavitalea soli]|uniref:Histidine kinase n=1 Tax=Paraflavitalea soli TaxID=2315862 RepID=A0A3B7MIH3_9BACT|nr:sensor histidine kinase [Paraflavitalea soli]AXY74008.1 histidine kinase [Paraflavitalea soli]